MQTLITIVNVLIKTLLTTTFIGKRCFLDIRYLAFKCTP